MHNRATEAQRLVDFLEGADVTLHEWSPFLAESQRGLLENVCTYVRTCDEWAALYWMSNMY